MPISTVFDAYEAELKLYFLLRVKSDVISK